MKIGFTYLAILILLLIGWEYWGDKEGSTVKLLISYPSAILEYSVENIDNILNALKATFIESILGLICAIVVSFVFIIVCLVVRGMLNFVLPIFIFSQVIPIIALAPLLLLIFGVGYTSKIIMAMLVCFFPLFMSFYSGIMSISKQINELLYIYEASKTFKIFKIYFPLSTRHIFSGLKVSAPLSVIGAIVAEFSGAKFGIGKSLILALKRLEPELLIISIISSILLGGTIFSMVFLVERKVGAWYLK